MDIDKTPELEGGEMIMDSLQNPQTTHEDYTEDTNADPEGVANRNDEDIPEARGSLPGWAERNYELSSDNLYGYAHPDGGSHVRPKADFIKACLESTINFNGIKFVDITQQPDDGECIHGWYTVGQNHNEAIEAQVEAATTIMLGMEKDERFQYVAMHKMPAEYWLARRAIAVVLERQVHEEYHEADRANLSDKQNEYIAVCSQRKIETSAMSYKYVTIYASLVKANGGKNGDMSKYFYIEKELKKYLNQQANWLDDKWLKAPAPKKQFEYDKYLQVAC
tara:strand:+ start:22944 stop:23780 length:837 start_codon:yes stop_codon:yes gene_type:complete